MRIRRESVEAATTGRNRAAPRAAASPSALPPERQRRRDAYVSATRSPLDMAAFERAIGTNDLVGIDYLWRALRAMRAVGRIQVAPHQGDPGGNGTGFLIAPGLLLTNWHVLETRASAANASVQFGYEADRDGRERPSTWFHLDPSPETGFYLSHDKLDCCVVAVDPESKRGDEPLASFGWLRLNPRLGKTDLGQYLSVIQHPGGEIKQLAIRENELLPFDDHEDFLWYASDTFRGSSGSPVLNDFWEVVALHHAGKPKLQNGNYVGHDGKEITDRVPLEHEIQWEANEGVRVSRIVAHLLANVTGKQREILEQTFDGRLKLDEPPEAGVGRAPESGPIGPPPGGSDRRVWVSLPLGVSLRADEGAGQDAPQAPARGTDASKPPARTTEPGVPVLLEKLNFDDDYRARGGFVKTFLGRNLTVAMPTIDRNHRGEIAPTRSGGGLLHYHHFSVAVHAPRRMPVLSAGNVDYGSEQRNDWTRARFGTDQWIADPRMKDEYQIPKGFYERWKRLDYGHLVSREDNCWGSSDREIEFANADTFHMTNCTPQHEAFNRDVGQYDGLWGMLENTIRRQALRDAVITRLCVFAGPIFDDRHDLVCRDRDGDVRVPTSFWKVVVAPARDGLRAYGFIAGQKKDLADDPPFEDFSPAGFEDHQATLAEIERRTIVRFAARLKHVDVMLDRPGHPEIAPLASLDDIWLGRR